MNQVKTKRQIRLRVAALAQQKGLSDRELAHQANVSVTVVRRMWNNQQTSQLLLGQLARVAEALDVPTGALIEDVAP